MVISASRWFGESRVWAQSAMLAAVYSSHLHDYDPLGRRSVNIVPLSIHQYTYTCIGPEEKNAFSMRQTSSLRTNERSHNELLNNKGQSESDKQAFTITCVIMPNQCFLFCFLSFSNQCWCVSETCFKRLHLISFFLIMIFIVFIWVIDFVLCWQYVARRLNF